MERTCSTKVDEQKLIYKMLCWHDRNNSALRCLNPSIIPGGVQDVVKKRKYEENKCAQSMAIHIRLEWKKRFN